MMRIIAIRATQNHCTPKPSVAEFAVRALSTGSKMKPCGNQIGDKLADFSRHKLF